MAALDSSPTPSPQNNMGQFEHLGSALATWNGSARDAAQIAGSICAAALTVFGDHRSYRSDKLEIRDLCDRLTAELVQHVRKPTTDQSSYQMMKTLLRQLPALKSTDQSESERVKSWLVRIRIIHGLECAFKDSHGLAVSDARAALQCMKIYETAPASNEHVLENLGSELYDKITEHTPDYRLPPSAVKILAAYVGLQHVDNDAVTSLLVDSIQSLGPIASDQFAALFQNSIKVGYRLTVYPDSQNKQVNLRRLERFFGNIFRAPHASFERCNWQLLREEDKTYQSSPLVLEDRDFLGAPTWLAVGTQGRQVNYRSHGEAAISKRYGLGFSDERLTPQMVRAFTAAEKVAHERLTLVHADVLAAFDTFEFDARHVAPGRESVIERFATWASLRTPRVSQAARFSYPGPGLVFDFGQLTEQLFLADPTYADSVAKSVRGTISVPMLDELPTVSMAALQGQFVVTFPNLLISIGGRQIQYAAQFCNSHIPGVIGETMRLVPASYLPVLAGGSTSSAALTEAELQQFHPYSLAAEAKKQGLPVFDLFHPAGVLTGAAHPVWIDGDLRCHVEHPRMRSEDWLSVNTAAEQSYQMMRIFQFACGYHKVTTRVNHVFRDGTTATMDLMLSELLAWHERALAGDKNEFPPLLRFAPFHFRRRLSPSEENQFDDLFSSHSSPLGVIIDSANLRMNRGRCPDGEYVARIWLRAHGKDMTVANAMQTWEETIVPLLVDKMGHWTGIEPRFEKATLPADKYYG